jgi:hypothetical protein
LCPSCHRIADDERRENTERARWEKRLSAWATKKYGPDWRDWKDEDDVDEEFRDWLDRRGETLWG